MKIQDIRKMAKGSGIDSFGKSKAEIIRALQKAEGNFDCYGRAGSGFCDQAGCLWKEDCLSDSVEAPPPAPTSKAKAVKAPGKTAPRKK
jgi:hypothetical protein